MVNIHQEFDAAFGLHHFETIEGRLLKIERTDELAFVCGQLLVGHFIYGHFHGNAIRKGLHHGVAFRSEMDMQFRMGLNDPLDGIR